MATFNIHIIPSQKGRIAIVTGANNGLGYETALALAKKDMKVILACRNLAKAEIAKQAICKEVPQAEIDIMVIDLSKLASVRTFANAFLEKYTQLDILINNAGIMTPPFSLSEEGFESQMAANYFGHFLLTALLLEMLMKTPHSRIVTLSSIAHKTGKINFDDLQSQKKYSPMVAYSQSKLACLMFSYELQRRLTQMGSQTISLAAHPGISDTNLLKNTPIPNWLFDLFKPIMNLTFLQSAKAGAEPTLYAALGEDVKGGDYFGPDGFNEMRGRAKKVESTPLSKDETLAKKLWEVSERLCKIRQ